MNSKQLLACLLVCAILFSSFHDSEGWRRRRRRRRSGKMDESRAGFEAEKRSRNDVQSFPELPELPELPQEIRNKKKPAYAKFFDEKEDNERDD